MTVYAIIESDVVVNTIVWDGEIDIPDLLKDCELLEVDAKSVGVGYRKTSKGNFMPLSPSMSFCNTCANFVPYMVNSHSTSNIMCH